MIIKNHLKFHVDSCNKENAVGNNSMLNFSNVWGKISNNKLLSSFAENYNKLKDTINGKFNIIEIVPRLYHIDYPQTHYVQILAEHIAGDA